MIGEEPSQRYWILSLPVDNCWTKCVICILKFVVFQILGKLIFLKKDLYKSSWLFFVIFKFGFPWDLFACTYLGTCIYKFVTHLWREDKDASQGAVIKVESPSDKRFLIFFISRFDILSIFEKYRCASSL